MSSFASTYPTQQTAEDTKATLSRLPYKEINSNITTPPSQSHALMPGSTHRWSARPAPTAAPWQLNTLEPEHPAGFPAS